MVPIANNKSAGNSSLVVHICAHQSGAQHSGDAAASTRRRSLPTQDGRSVIGGGACNRASNRRSNRSCLFALDYAPRNKMPRLKNPFDIKKNRSNKNGSSGESIFANFETHEVRSAHATRNSVISDHILLSVHHFKREQI
jgi:hypothetical protein